jgi:hypothetical protein
MAAWFIEQLDWAKKMYMTMVIAMLPKYMPRVEPIRRLRQSLESVSSIFSMQCSAQVCARSTSKIKPRSKNKMAPPNAT